MNLRCSYCQTMFALGRETMLTALEQMETEGLHHYDAHCPRCRRANSMSRDRLEKAYPGWREALKEMQKQAAKAEKEQDAAVEEKPAKAAAKPATVIAKPPAKSEAAKKPAAAVKAKPAPKTEKPFSKGKKPFTGTKSK
jgi:phage FluMu protein Com